MKALWRILARVFAGLLALGYLLAPAALIFAATPPPTCQILLSNAAPSIYGPTGSPSLTINVGDSVTVSWMSTNATAGAITNIGNVGPTGSINLLPSSAIVTTYFGAFTGPGGTTNCQASVMVDSNTYGPGGVTNTAGKTTNTTPATTPAAQPTAPSSGLVPCGYGAFDPNGANGASSSTGCQACNLAQLIQNIMTFAIGIAIPIAAALFAYAGFLYITSATNTGNIAKAKGIFKDAFIGFLIAICAWLIINTLLHVIFSQGTFASGNWFTIQCSAGSARPVNKTITGVLSSLPIVAGNAGQIQNTDGGVSANGYPSSGGSSTGGDSVYSCSAGSKVTYSNAEGGYYSCVSADGTETATQCNSAAGYHLANSSDINSSSYSGECANQNNQVVDYNPPSQVSQNAVGDCSAGALSSTWGSNASTMSCIVAGESSCNAGLLSKSDRGADGNSFSAGLYQINLTAANNSRGGTDLTDAAHNLNLPACTALNNGQPLNCGQAFSGKNYSATVVNQQLYNTCIQAAQNIECNTAAAQQLFQQTNGNFSQWSAYTNNHCGN
jgi:hypothetical protein